MQNARHVRYVHAHSHVHTQTLALNARCIACSDIKRLVTYAIDCPSVCGRGCVKSNGTLELGSRSDTLQYLL